MGDDLGAWEAALERRELWMDIAELWKFNPRNVVAGERRNDPKESRPLCKEK